MTQNRLVASILKSTSVLAVLTMASANASPQSEQTILSTNADRKDLELVVYQGGIAQIKDVRTIKFAKGLQRVHIEDVASSIIPQTSLFQAASINQLEQNYDFDLLTAQKLLEKAVGSTVWVTLQNPVTGEETREQAEVLSANGNAILKMADRIEVLGPNFMPGRISFDRLPENLRAKPTLSLLLDNENASQQETSLTYLAGDIRWRADYVATLNKQETEIDLKAWVTLNNQSGMSFENATIHVVAGRVNLDYSTRPSQVQASANADVMRRERRISREDAFSDFIQYTLPQKSTVSHNQQKQLSLFDVENVPVEKRYVFDSSGYDDHPDEYFVPANLIVFLNNQNDGGLAKSLPAGVFRVYAQSNQGEVQFVGEHGISNTPVGRNIQINYGQAFHITSHLDAKLLSKDCWMAEGRQQCIDEYQLDISLKNATDKKVDVHYNHRFYDDYEILSTSLEPSDVIERGLRWLVPIKANGENTFSIKVKVGALSQERQQLK